MARSGNAGQFLASCGMELTPRSLSYEAELEARDATNTGPDPKLDQGAAAAGKGNATTLSPPPLPIPVPVACPCNCTYVSNACCTPEAAAGIVVEDPMHKLGNLLPPDGWCCDANTGEFSVLPEGKTLGPNNNFC